MLPCRPVSEEPAPVGHGAFSVVFAAHVGRRRDLRGTPAGETASGTAFRRCPGERASGGASGSFRGVSGACGAPERSLGRFPSRRSGMAVPVRRVRYRRRRRPVVGKAGPGVFRGLPTERSGDCGAFGTAPIRPPFFSCRSGVCAPFFPVWCACSAR